MLMLYNLQRNELLSYCHAKGRHKKTVFFFTFSQKGGGLGQSKKSLSENTRTFLTDFDQRGGGLGKSKKSLSEKTEAVKKGPGGGLNFLTKSKKKPVFFYASP